MMYLFLYAIGFGIFFILVLGIVFRKYFVNRMCDVIGEKDFTEVELVNIGCVIWDSLFKFYLF